MVDTAPKPFVFVLMPFRDEFKDVYEVGIKQACSDAGAYCERVDEQMFEERIVERIYNQIAKADVVVADMTGQNPNVFYEVGYAHALAKRTILLTQKAADIPFDLKHYPHIIYGGSITDLRAELEKRITWMLANPRRSGAELSGEAELYIIGKRVELGTRLTRELGHDGYLRFKIDIRNPGNQVIMGDTMRITLRSGEHFPSGDYHHISNTIQLPEGGFLHYVKKVKSILPGEWGSAFVALRRVNSPPLVGGEIEQFTIRVYSEVRSFEVPFEIGVDPHPGYRLIPVEKV
jgi:hypothetical protein